ncbi:SCP-like protein [Streptococcus sp. oral taxon 058 str. F0407]|uniref:CAP domain-containing protein n=1 Tax=Streptococcus sp. oral taxon 058 TaxID=712622 RepID=UPI000234A43E|nr:CAP domain-containing protein [Streptococcus sp. oral taxon 058]EHI77497.1 SCP-like protein [Streptococcus sp. oral taxon 058 str. F0407]
MNRKYGLLAGAALATAVAVSASVTPTVHADNRWDSRHSWDYDFDDWDYSYNYWNRNNYRQPDSGRYFYWNGSYYYRMSDGSYYIYRDGEWKPLTNNRDNNSSTNNLVNDSHYRYENGYHYYVLENGDYYYYQNGRWVFVKKSADNNKELELENPGTVELPENPPFNGADEEFKPFDSGTIEFPETPSYGGADGEYAPFDLGTIELPENPPFNGADGELDPFTPKPDNSTNPSGPETPGLTTTDEPSENQIPPYVEKPAPGLEHLLWAPNGSKPKLVIPPGKPGDKILEDDPKYAFYGTDHYYYVESNAEVTGYTAYWKWMGDAWKLHGMTDPTDPALDPNLHSNPVDDEYSYSDQNSSVKLYSTNLVETAKAGQALPFKNVEEFKNYVIEKLNPRFLDNAGWDAKVTWEIEDEEIFEKTKNDPWARDYVLVANLKSGVDEEKYRDVEFGYVKFVFRVAATDDTNYYYMEKAKEAFAAINEIRKEQGLKELTWSDEIYQNQALPKANQISRQYDSSGFVGRRDQDAAAVVKKWANGGLRELLLDPNATEGAVAAVVSGNGDYYWAYNYK